MKVLLLYGAQLGVRNQVSPAGPGTRPAPRRAGRMPMS